MEGDEISGISEDKKDKNDQQDRCVFGTRLF